ncbi:MAG: DUF2358 domain-containing protein [Cyanophyceae cyanobacterium]
MDIVEVLRNDYQRFPKDQTYSLYAEDVYFKDPLNEFRGLKGYQGVIRMIDTIFQDINMDLHDIRLQGDVVKTEWTLHMTSPLPWKPRLAIPGWSELKLNQEQLVISHVDHWHISRLDVLKQNFS